jgi:hypothetical protein
MRDLVLVHGRAQEDKDADALKNEWIDALKQGLAAAGLVLPIPEACIRFPFYGNTLRDLAGGAATVASVVVRGEEQEEKYASVLTAVLEEVLAQHKVTDDMIGAAGPAPEPGQPVIGERGVLNRPWIRAMLAAVDRHVAVAGSAVIAITTRDVQRYLDNLPIRAAIESGVGVALEPEKPAVVVAHSLGSVVCYNLLRRDGVARGWRVPLFVTLGSPLGVDKIRALLNPLTYPACVGAWFNARDPRDIVSLHALDKTRFPVNPPIVNKTDVDNDTPDRHGIAGYLKDPVVAKTIYDALVAD